VDGTFPDVYITNIYFDERRMKSAKLFRNGESQAVRLPKEFRFEGTEVFIKRVGDAVVLLPKSRSWDSLVASLEKFPADFMEQRDQPPTAEERGDWS